VTEADTGTPIATLIRVSHIHLFGITVIFFVMGLMFSHAYVRPVWFKCAVIALPFRRRRIGYQFVVLHQAVPSVRLRVMGGGRTDGWVLRPSCGW